MNKRIKELYNTVAGNDKLNFDSYLAEKFAELIVQECIDRIKRVGILEDIENETDIVVSAVKEHFGFVIARLEE
jgi:hypothetical protein